MLRFWKGSDGPRTALGMAMQERKLAHLEAEIRGRNGEPEYQIYSLSRKP